MTGTQGIGAKTIAAVRIATGIIFLFFAEYKIASSAWAYGGFEVWIRQFVNEGTAVGFYNAFLVNFVLIHPVLCARIVAWGELAIGLSLLFGFLVRPASVGGVILMIALVLSTWYSPGHDAASWKYLGANLDHIPLLFLFVIFYATRAGNVWGFDDRRCHPRSVSISGFGQSRRSSSQN
jgi:thiosulfate dehydrogenase (quinone) large subunit